MENDMARSSDILGTGVAPKQLGEEECRILHRLIESTKYEIGLMHYRATDGEKLERAGAELLDVLQTTETATGRIINAVEIIDENASQLASNLKDTNQQALAKDIQEQIVAVYQACNFQDLSGQRITKVIKTLAFLETRLEGLMNLWGGSDQFVLEDETAERDNKCDLLNGPGLENQDDMTSQADIDALFD